MFGERDIDQLIEPQAQKPQRQYHQLVGMIVKIAAARSRNSPFMVYKLQQGSWGLLSQSSQSTALQRLSIKNSNPADRRYGSEPDLQYYWHEAEDSAMITRQMPKSRRAACDI